MAVLHRRLPRGKDVLFEEALADKFFKDLLEASAVDGLMPLTVMVRTIFFCFGKWVVLDWLLALYPQLVLNGVEDFVDWEPQWSEVLFHLESFGWIW